jgi:tetratricopeptide (TPR) repeat protein/4-amino-4-deoxy-L-arabinose transferase-like glycosyltransferase
VPVATAIFVVALAVRLIHIWQIRRAPFFTVLMGDAQGYDAWGQRIARGDWLGHEVFYQAPLYPYFLGLIYSLVGRNMLIVRVCQAIVGSTACVLLALTARRLFSTRTGLVAGLVLALYAPAIFFDGLLQKSVLDVFFLCLALWVLSGLVVTPRSRGWIWFGMAMGGLALTRENALVLAGVVFLWAVLRPHPSLTERAVAATGLVLGLSLVLLPVALRNHAVGGGFYLTTSQFGPNFYIGNNSRADGTYMSLRFGRGAPEFERKDATELAELAMGRTLTPGEVSTYWADRALDFITSQPVAWLTLLGRKFVLLWNRTEMLDTESQETYAEWSDPIRFGAWLGNFGILVPLAVFGVWTTWSKRRRLFVFYAMGVAYAASVLMFYVFARYRFPLVPLLVLFAAAGIVGGGGFLATSSTTSKCGVCSVVGAAVLMTNWPTLSVTMMRAVTETNLATSLHEEGRLDEAVDHYRRAIALKPDYTPAFTNMGVTLVAKGLLDEGIVAFERAIALRPDYPEAHYNLANALMKQNRPAEAAGHLRVALQAMPHSVEVRNNLGIALATQGRLDEAVAEFRQSVKIDPRSAKAHRNLADVLASLGHQDEALEHFRRSTAIEPGDASLHYDLGSLLLEAHRLPEAIDEFRAALKLTPDSFAAHNNLGIALGSQGDLDEAIVQFQFALELQPQSAEARRNLASALQARAQTR